MCSCSCVCVHGHVHTFCLVYICQMFVRPENEETIIMWLLCVLIQARSESHARCFPQCMNVIMIPRLTDVTLKGHNGLIIHQLVY